MSTGPRESTGVVVSVVGAGSPTAEEYATALEVGRELGRRGAVVLTGGLGGVMEAACRGAREHGALTIGVLPGRCPGEANEFVVVPVVTGLGDARNVVVALSGAGMIAVGGRYGTLSEMALAMNAGRPVVALGSWTSRGSRGEDAGFIRCADAREAVERLFSLLADNAQHGSR